MVWGAFLFGGAGPVVLDTALFSPEKVANGLQIDCKSKKGSCQPNFLNMATLNIILDTRRQKAGKKYPLKARINHLKKSTYLSLDIDLDAREWDHKKQRVRPSYPLQSKLNLKITSVLTGLQEVILDLEKAGRPYSAKSIKEKYLGLTWLLLTGHLRIFHLRKMLQQHPVDEDIAAAYALHEVQFIDGVIEELGVVPGAVAPEVDKEAEGVVAYDGHAASLVR